MNKKLERWVQLYTDAKSHRAKIDSLIPIRNNLYNGTGDVTNKTTGQISKKKGFCYRNMCFELIEAQINNAIPYPKVTPRDKKDQTLASQLEEYERLEMDRMDSETINDAAERGTLKQGTAFYLVGWNSMENTPVSQGELYIKYYPLEYVYPQPGITLLEDAEYIFTRDLISIRSAKKLYGKDIPDDGEFRGKQWLITAWYLNDDDYLSRFGWIENTDIILFDDDAYELRRFKVCKECGEKMYGDTCKVCGSDKYEYKVEEEETLKEDLIMYDPNNPKDSRVVAKQGDKIPYYKIKQLPFVLRKNVSNGETLYGVSDIDVIRNNQESLNKVSAKIEENILKGGSILMVPKGVNIPNTDETLKRVIIDDPKLADAIKAVSLQANTQQDSIFQESLYQTGRDSLGITDSYQGKRDTTAESGKAKQVAAAQSAGRLESKRRMKDAAYADLYKLMFKFLLAYCDEPRTYTTITPEGKVLEAKFNRYNFLAQDADGKLYYNDRFLFDVDDASTLMTNREALWQETTNKLVSGAFGNPADPRTLALYWNLMQGLNYPLAKQTLAYLQQQTQQLDPAIQQAIMQNPQILQAVQQVIAEGGKPNEDNKQ